MTLRELLHAAYDTGNMMKIAGCIQYTYTSDTGIDVIGTRYKNVILEMLELDTVETLKGYELYVRDMIDADGVAVADVCLYDTDSQETAAVDLIDWRELIDLPLRLETPLDIISTTCHVLWELTFYGSTNASVIEAHKQMKQDIDRMDKDNLISYEEFKKELDEID